MSLARFFEKLIGAEIGIPSHNLTPELINKYIERANYKTSPEFISSYGGHTTTATNETPTEEQMNQIRKENDQFLSAFL